MTARVFEAIRGLKLSCGSGVTSVEWGRAGSPPASHSSPQKKGTGTSWSPVRGNKGRWIFCHSWKEERRNKQTNKQYLPQLPQCLCYFSPNSRCYLLGKYSRPQTKWKLKPLASCKSSLFQTSNCVPQGCCTCGMESSKFTALRLPLGWKRGRVSWLDFSLWLLTESTVHTVLFPWGLTSLNSFAFMSLKKHISNITMIFFPRV